MKPNVAKIVLHAVALAALPGAPFTAGAGAYETPSYTPGGNRPQYFTREDDSRNARLLGQDRDMDQLRKSPVPYAAPLPDGVERYPGADGAETATAGYPAPPSESHPFEDWQYILAMVIIGLFIATWFAASKASRKT